MSRAVQIDYTGQPRDRHGDTSKEIFMVAEILVSDFEFSGNDLVKSETFSL